MNKKGRSEIEKFTSLVFGIVVLFVLFNTLVSSGILKEIFSSLNQGSGIFGVLIGIMIILAIIKAILEAFEKNDFF